MRLLHLAATLTLGLPAVLWAQTCVRPHPFDRTASIRGNVAFVPSDGSTCDLVVSLMPNNSTPSGAFAWYSLPNPEQLWRISFRIDASGFSNDSLAAVGVLSVTSRQPWPVVNGDAALLRVTLWGGISDPPSPLVSLSGACSGSAPVCTQGSYYDVVPATISSGDLLRFELSVGEGAAGQVRFWQNADFTDPPTAVLTGLDNAMWQGAQHVGLGIFDSFYSIVTTGASVRFSEIETSDDILFWSDFDE